jgi:hypothetical protein
MRLVSCNVLIDSPRAASPLLKRLEALGGVSKLFLTHRDDVLDYRFECVLPATAAASGCPRQRCARRWNRS